MSTKSPRYNASLARARSSSGIQQQALNSTATGPINQLTPILLLDVFAHVRSVQGLATCSLVCRQWHALTWTYALEMDLSSFQNGTNQVLPVNDMKLTYLSALSPSVRHLNLRHCVAITDDGISALTTLTNLRTLLLHGCRLLTDKALKELVKIPRLERVDLSGLNGFSSAGLKHLGELEHLQSLSLRGIDTVDDRVLEAIASLKRLRQLDVSSCVGVGEDGIKFLGNVPTLTSLNLSGNSRLGQQRAWNHLKLLTNLEQLKVKSVVFTEDQMDDFCDTLPRWKMLTELRMGFCQIRDQHCPAFGSLPNLKILSIHNASALKADAYVHFARVTDLDLSRSTIPVHALEHLSHLTRLELKNSKLSSATELRPKRIHSLPSPSSPPQSVVAPSPSTSDRTSKRTPSSSNEISKPALTDSRGSNAALTISTNSSIVSPSSSVSTRSPLSSLAVSPSSVDDPTTSNLSWSLAGIRFGSYVDDDDDDDFYQFDTDGNHDEDGEPVASPSSSYQSALSMSPPYSSAATSPASSSSSSHHHHHHHHGHHGHRRKSETSPLASSTSAAPSSPSPSSSLPRAIPKRKSIDTPTSSSLRGSAPAAFADSVSPPKSRSLKTSSNPLSHAPSTPTSPPRSQPLTEPVEIRSLHSLRSISSLRKLSLRVENMTDDDLRQISKCRKLRELDLLWLSSVTSRGLQKLGRLVHLQSLNLTNCKTLTNETLQAILPNLTQLRALSLAHCILVGDAGLLAIASNSLLLKYLVLFQLQLITNEGITSLVTLNDLEVLEVSGCHQIDVPYCQALLKEFLPGLHLNHNSQPRDPTNSSTHCVIS